MAIKQGIIEEFDTDIEVETDLFDKIKEYELKDADDDDSDGDQVMDLWMIFSTILQSNLCCVGIFTLFIYSLLFSLWFTKDNRVKNQDYGSKQGQFF